MTDENLIEEAAKAMFDARFAEDRALGIEIPAWDDEPIGIREGWIGQVRAAFAVFEKAHAPTDELARLRRVAETMSAVSDALRTRYAGDSQAAYFMRQINTALDAAPEPQGEPSEAQVRAVVRALDVHRWKTMGVASVECECGDVLGLDQISDAIEDAALLAFPADAVFREHIARAALRAAEGAR